MTPERRNQIEYGLFLIDFAERTRGKPLVGSMLREVWDAAQRAALTPRPEHELIDAQRVEVFRDSIPRQLI